MDILMGQPFSVLQLLMNKGRKSEHVPDSDKAPWGPLWNEENDIFNDTQRIRSSRQAWCTHTENLLIKTSLVHTLYRVCKYGVMLLDKFSDHLSASEMSQCIGYDTHSIGSLVMILIQPKLNV